MTVVLVVMLTSFGLGIVFGVIVGLLRRATD